jgi:hypothetical protein
VVEKPFGTDRDSAAELNRLLARTVGEQATFRVDHFLAKQSVLNVLGLLRCCAGPGADPQFVPKMRRVPEQRSSRRAVGRHRAAADVTSRLSFGEPSSAAFSALIFSGRCATLSR